MRPSSVAKQSIQAGVAVGARLLKVMVRLVISTGTGGLGKSAQGNDSGSAVETELRGSLSDVKAA